MKYLIPVILLCMGCFNTPDSALMMRVNLLELHEKQRKAAPDYADRIQHLENQSDEDGLSISELEGTVQKLGEDIADLHGDTRHEAAQERLTCLETLTTSLQEKLTALENKKSEGVSAPTPTPVVIPPLPRGTLYSIKQGRNNRGIMFTSSSCVWCKQIERNEGPKLVQSGWSVGHNNTDNFEIVDINTDKGQAYLKELGWNGTDNLYLPKIVRVVNGEMVSEHTGFMSAKDLAAFLNGKPTTVKSVNIKEKVAGYRRAA